MNLSSGLRDRVRQAAGDRFVERGSVVRLPSVRRSRCRLLPATDRTGPKSSQSFRLGHDTEYWTRFLRALAEINPDIAVNLEHEDAAYSQTDGLALAAKNLHDAAAAL